MAHASIGTFGIGLVIAMFAITAFGASTFASPHGSNTVLTLAQDGMTDYGIVIAQNADKRIVTASEELAHFLTTMTRAKFEVRRDDSPVSDFEIVLGETNRKMLEGVPPALRPKTWEGFVILSEGDKLFIIGGQIPRGTLYGVYDFLERELGVRFLAPEVTHVPRRSTLQVAVPDRVFDPPFEFRAHMSPHNARDGYGEWSGRSRINSESVGWGNVRRIGRQVHSFAFLVPPKTYFDKNPEMFALIDGERSSRELCLSHPETLRVATEKALDWARSAPKDPDIRSIVHLSQNDTGSPGCQCTDCAAADAEAGTVFTGQLMRFVNKIAREIGRERPDVYVETLAYHRSEYPPANMVAEPNVVIWFAPIGLDLGHPLDEQPKHWNNLQGWRRVCPRIFIWDYPQGFHDLLAPFPSLWTTARNIQLFAENGTNGYMPQQPVTDGTEMRYLRNYVWVQLQWRPDQDYRELADEFCRLYYGQRAGVEIMAYLDLLHDSFRGKNLKLNRHGSYKQDDFVPAADAILARAAALADLPEQQRRVAEFRLPIWRLMLIQAFGEHGKVMSLSDQWWYRPEAVADEDADFGKTTNFSGWQQVQIPTIPAAEYSNGASAGPGWYALQFNMPDTNGAPLALHFEAMDGTWDVHIDGKEIAANMPSGLGLYREKEVPYLLLKDGLSPGLHTVVVRVRDGSGFYKLEQYQNPDFTTADAVTIVNMATALPPALRTAAESFVDACVDAGLVRISYGYAPAPTPYLKDLLWPKIRFLLTHGESHGP